MKALLEKTPTWLLAALWMMIVALGFSALIRYATTPGAVTLAPATSPESSELAHTKGRYTLLMFAFSHCPCTRATLDELDKLIKHIGDRAEVTIVYSEPDGIETDHIKDELYAKAKALPGVKVVSDKGKEATLFGARTSGATLLYDPEGNLRFSGGLTAIRGHAGSGRGVEFIISLVMTGAADGGQSPVFGCPITTTEEIP